MMSLYLLIGGNARQEHSESEEGEVCRRIAYVSKGSGPL